MINVIYITTAIIDTVVVTSDKVSLVPEAKPPPKLFVYDNTSKARFRSSACNFFAAGSAGKCHLVCHHFCTITCNAEAFSLP